MSRPTAAWALRSEHSGVFLRLQRTLRSRDSFTLCFLVYSDSAYRATVASFLGARLGATAEIAIDANWQDGTEQLLDRIRAARNDGPVQLFGFHRWPLGLDDLLARLNHRRESIAERFPYALLVWARESDLSAIATQAADLWAWRTGVFDFTLPGEPRRAAPHGYHSHPATMTAAERRSRIEALQGYLEEQLVLQPIDAELLLELGDLHRFLGDTKEAEKVYQQAERVLAKSEDRRRLAVARGRIADILALRGRLDEALQLRRTEELPVYKELGDWRLYAVTQGEIADILTSRGDLAEALDIRRTAELPIYERIGLERLAAVTKGQISDILFAQGQFTEALQIREQELLPWFQQAGDVHSVAVTSGRIADVLEMRGLFDEALRVRTDEELPVYEKLGDRRASAVTKVQIADILRSRGELDQALRIIQEEALPVFKELGYTRGLAFAYDKIANIYQMQERLDDALDLRRGLELPIYKEIGDKRALAATNGQIADILELRGELDEALRIRIEEEIPFYEGVDDGLWALTKAQIAGILKAQGRFDEALRTLREDVIPMWSRTDDPGHLAAAQGEVAEILSAQRRFDEALAVYTNDVIPLFNQLGNARSQALAISRVADILRALGRANEALKLLREEIIPIFEGLGDVDRHEETARRIAKMAERDHYLGHRYDVPEGPRVKVERSDGTELQPGRAIDALQWDRPGVFDFGGHTDGAELLGAAILLDSGVDITIVGQIYKDFAASVIADLTGEWTLRVVDVRAWLTKRLMTVPAAPKEDGSTDTEAGGSELAAP